MSVYNVSLNVRTIFDREAYDMSENHFSPKYYCDKKQGRKGIVSGAEISESICDDVPNNFIIYPNLDILLKFANLYPNESVEKKEIIGLCITILASDTRHLKSGHRYKKCTVAGLALYFLIKISKVESAMIAVMQRVKKKLPLDTIIQTINTILEYEYYTLTSRDLIQIEELLQFVKSKYSWEFYGKELEKGIKFINQIKYKTIETNLEYNSNPQIDEDKQEVVEFVNKYGFDKNVEEAFKKIDELELKVSDKFDYRNAITLLKEIVDNITEKTIKDIQYISGEAPEKKSEKEDMKQAKFRFMYEKLEFSEGLKRIFSGLNKSLNEVKHSFISDRKLFRLTKNMTIELLVILFTKFESYKNQTIRD